MSEPTSSDRLRSAMLQHDISSADLVKRLLRDEAVGLQTAHTLVDRFVNGGACSLGVAAALVTIIVDRKRT